VSTKLNIFILSEIKPHSQKALHLLAARFVNVKPHKETWLLDGFTTSSS